MADVEEAITRAHQEEWARVVAALTRRYGDLDIAEEAAAEAFATAVEKWPAEGVPPNPGAWLTVTASRKALDRIRRENKRENKQNEAHMLKTAAVRVPRCHGRRATLDNLHLLSTGACGPELRGADTAHGRRSDRARDRRPGLVTGLVCRLSSRRRRRGSLPPHTKRVRSRCRFRRVAVQQGTKRLDDGCNGLVFREGANRSVHRAAVP